MSVPTTWTELKAEIATLIVRDDLTSLIPNFIGYAEAWLDREVNAPEREASATLTITSNYASLPTDFRGVVSIYVDGTNDTELERVTPARLKELYPTTSTGTPAAYSIESETVYFGPWPSSGTVIILHYVQALPRLGGSQATNWLLTDHPDIYVYATMAETCDYTRDPDEANRWRTKAAICAESINRAGRRRKTNSGPLRASIPIVQVSSVFAA